uniref:Uncharacterized protein n=1 Tax=Anguilla anguilla TaxID=7936 RepID=A0A0E9WE91_ANGAN
MYCSRRSCVVLGPMIPQAGERPGSGTISPSNKSLVSFFNRIYNGKRRRIKHQSHSTL